ncbi:galactarate dehydratase [Burkholderia multivorans]|uniref:Galactarate dehydratase n=1 Tax=Burkholderia multivorans TaxID=87883 RepID=A0AAP2HNB7_9BURK|nr:galactarate dehydratase [Burkholderia multivorans]MBU9359435.1 galactarate dehydratase [Burkholderia multivorans]MBU9365859.1 galactarate dehydratase [Burkholderia multivorans]MBU9596228.1 galactarate dehydratase [Burkholderia multivorans]MCA8486445.1 galactarate dehydratase [Burkholderia multivorans]MDN7873077.1 galactarate dehydratase [Burkholderia multivorans]
MTASPLYIRVHPDDNVAIVVNDGGLPEGATFADGLTLREGVPQGHKVALTDLAAGDPIVRYNVVIGYALTDLRRGSWVNERTMRMPEPPGLDDLPLATRRAPPLAPLEGYTFEGFRNPDGSVGTRNILAITTTVQCVAGVVEHAVKRIKAELLPRYPNVDDVVGLEHTYGCGVAIDAPDADIPIRTLRNISLNPNFGGEVMTVSLGCEKLQPDRLLPPGAIPVVAAEGEPDNGGVVCLQDAAHVGFQSMIDSIMTMAESHLERLNRRRRETCPASDLVVGVQCGGSDAFSGLTANPAVGFAADLLVRAGATIMFSEVTEVRDGVAQLTSRAANEDVAREIIREMDWYDRYLQRGRVDRSANTTPGNKKGGLSNIVEKAMGSIVKSGSAPIAGVVRPGERARQKGLLYTATPASDFICGTLQLAAGMNLHVFTTGRGTPYGLAQVPVIKVATRSDLARRWYDLMDLDAGRIATGAATIEDVGWELFHMMLDVASGKRRTWAEQWKLANALVLFNPAPVT